MHTFKTKSGKGAPKISIVMLEDHYGDLWRTIDGLNTLVVGMSYGREKDAFMRRLEDLVEDLKSLLSLENIEVRPLTANQCKQEE